MFYFMITKESEGDFPAKGENAKVAVSERLIVQTLSSDSFIFLCWLCGQGFFVNNR